MNESVLLEALNIHYKINGKLILDDVSLSVCKGRVTGLLGQNGAGKTTLLNILAGCVEPTYGKVLVNGKSVFRHPELKLGMGYLPDQPALQDTFSVSEQLNYAAALFNSPFQAVTSVIERCDLGDLQNRLNGQLSKGQRQRVGIAQAILHQPEIIILDEPGEGLDPIQIQFFRNLITELKQDCAIILSTHLIAEVARVCDEVIVLQQGTITQQQNLDETNKLIKLVFAHDIDAQQLEQCTAITNVSPLGPASFRVVALDSATAGKQIIELCHKNQWSLLEMQSGYSDFAEHFFKLEAGNNRVVQDDGDK